MEDTFHNLLQAIIFQATSVYQCYKQTEKYISLSSLSHRKLLVWFYLNSEGLYLTYKKKVTLSNYTPWWHMGGDEV
jgi:hypothetical protein